MADFHNRRYNDMDTDIKLAFSRQGAPTSPQTPNQISEMGRLLNSGMKNVEIGAIQQDVFETIPEQHFKEMRRLAKLTDSNVSVHAPIIDPAGFTQQGWSEESRRENERYIESVLDRAHQLDPSGNVPVNMHTTIGVPGQYTEKIDGEEVKRTMYIIDHDQGKIVPLEREELEYLEGKKIRDPDSKLREINHTMWDQEKMQLMAMQDARDNLLKKKLDKEREMFRIEAQYPNGEIPPEKIYELQSKQREIAVINRHIQEYNQQLFSNLNKLHDKFVKYYKPTKKEEKKYSKKINDILKGAKKVYIEGFREVDEIEEQMKKKKNKPLSERDIQELTHLQKQHFQKIIDMSNETLDVISELPAPELYVPVEEFAREKTVETISNVAKRVYKKYGDKAPIIALENVFPNMVLSRAGEMKKLIEESRDKFAEQIAKEKKIDKKKAKKIAEKIIGATWDVGHIHQLKKQGYTEKDIIEETKKIAKYVKHVHLTDNFGFADSHLALGMGDVPIKEHLKELEKAADKERRNIIESGGYAAHFKTSPLMPSLEYLNSPVYSYDAGPYWSDARDLYASYLVGYGDILPEKHFDTFFGAGFSRLPKELGGQSSGNRSRFAGTPNQ